MRWKKNKKLICLTRLARLHNIFALCQKHEGPSSYCRLCVWEKLVTIVFLISKTFLTILILPANWHLWWGFDNILFEIYHFYFFGVCLTSEYKGAYVYWFYVCPVNCNQCVYRGICRITISWFWMRPVCSPAFVIIANKINQESRILRWAKKLLLISNQLFSKNFIIQKLVGSLMIILCVIVNSSQNWILWWAFASSARRKSRVLWNALRPGTTEMSPWPPFVIFHSLIWERAMLFWDGPFVFLVMCQFMLDQASSPAMFAWPYLPFVVFWDGLTCRLELCNHAAKHGRLGQWRILEWQILHHAFRTPSWLFDSLLLLWLSNWFYKSLIIKACCSKPPLGESV